MPRLATSFSAALIALGGLLAQPIRAENVDLSTAPRRNSVQLTIYNSEDLTLVRETRKVSFKPGVNPLQFSWANTLIDPTSVELRFLTHGEKLSLLDTTFPHAKPEMLYWNVQSDFDGEATVEISYFTSGIHWSADYIGIADAGETSIDLEGFVRIDNRSGEEYEGAQVRLVVGRVNLVEKIAELARVSQVELSLLGEREKAGVKFKALRQLAEAKGKAAKDEEAALEASDAEGIVVSKAAPKQVVKEGLGEYFIYTIEGTETIPNAWGKRLRSLEAAKVPLKIQYRYRPAEYGDELVRMYLLVNNKESKLGTTPLPDGTFRLFRQNGRDGLSYLRPTVHQVRAYRRQDRTEPGRRPRGDLRTGQAPPVARCDLDANPGRKRLPPHRPAGGADRGQQPGRRLGRSHPFLPAGAELHKEAGRVGGPPQLRRAGDLPQRTGGHEP